MLSSKFSRVPDAMQRATLLRRSGTHWKTGWAPDQQRTTSLSRRTAQHPGNAGPVIASQRVARMRARWQAPRSDL